mmetsp:Transcript_22501/g.76489  ORF Transcript_22501/g.76489 Transcript_22501/m.76489 type:complete len:331 (-) Transcript_22501:111-1103(-)
MTTSTCAPPTAASARPILLTPLLSPRASPMHCPTVIATSSAVWWSSIHRSPDASTTNATPASSRTASSMASSVPMPVRAPPPSPSRSSSTDTDVSAVERLLDALLVPPGAGSGEGAPPAAASSAARSPLANALKLASTMWWALSPRRFQSPTRQPAPSTTPSKNAPVSAVWYVPMRSRPAPFPYGARLSSSSPAAVPRSRRHSEYASSSGAQKVARSDSGLGAAATAGSNAAPRARPSARPAAAYASGSEASEDESRPGSHGGSPPSTDTCTLTPSCACAVSWSTMWSRNGRPVAITPRGPKSTTRASADATPTVAAPAPSAACARGRGV